MKKAYVTLKRKPLLTPIWLAAVASILVVTFAAWLWSTATSTTVIVIRHAEKRVDRGDDPPLDERGVARAARLAVMLGASGLGQVNAIYASPTQRSRDTAAPLANRLRIAVITAPSDDSKRLARRVLKEQQGRVALIVAHSDTAPDLVAALSGAREVPPIADGEYGALYLVTVPRIGHPSVVRMEY